MTDIIKAAKKLIDCVEFDMNGAGGKGGNGGLLSDTTLRAAHDLRVIMSREAEREQKQPSAAPKPLAWYWEDKSGCFHMVMDRPDVQAMAAEFFCDPKPLYPEAWLPAVSEWRTMDTAPRNGTVIQAWHTVHKCPLSILWNAKGHDFNGETLHWFERSYTTAWPEDVFSHWMLLPSQPVPPSKQEGPTLAN